MIARLRCGVTVASKADAYLVYLHTIGVADDQATAGNEGLHPALDGEKPGAFSPALALGLQRDDSTTFPSYRSKACSPSI
jgi:hypothetical protein